MSFERTHESSHVGNNICETYPRWIGQGLNEASCMLGSMLSSLMGLPNPAWVSLANVVSHIGSQYDSMTMRQSKSQDDDGTRMCLSKSHDDASRR